MARTELTAQRPTSSGLEITFAAANAAGHFFKLQPGRELRVKNGSGGSINVTLQTPGSVDGLAIADKVIAIADTKEFTFANIPENVYARSDGTIYVDFSGVSSVTVALVDTL